MATLTPEKIAELLQPYLKGGRHEDGQPGRLFAAGNLYAALAAFLDLLLKWNARTNLTAIRDPEEIVRRHFGESLFVAGHLGDCDSLLDFGSGAGFPGIPIQLACPTLKVTLAESQGKKAAFLREAVRELGLSAEIWAGRVEAMTPEQRFEVVALRAVDSLDTALAEAGKRATRQLAAVGSSELELKLDRLLPEFSRTESVPIPGLRDAYLFLASRPGAK
jgi:16S rRNA (guanine527-N7)-methyltransferase